METNICERIQNLKIKLDLSIASNIRDLNESWHMKEKIKQDLRAELSHTHDERKVKNIESTIHTLDKMQDKILETMRTWSEAQVLCECTCDSYINEPIDIPLNRTYCTCVGSKDVLTFIENFLGHQNALCAENILKDQFNAGYCYYFALMLKAAFNRGEICWCAPYGHICWVDDDKTPYDIYGICTSDCEHYIPISFLGDALQDFLHTDKSFCASKEDIQNIIDRYLKSVNE